MFRKAQGTGAGDPGRWGAEVGGAEQRLREHPGREGEGAEVGRTEDGGAAGGGGVNKSRGRWRTSKGR